MSRVCCQLGSESRPAVSYPGALPRRRENDERKSPAQWPGFLLRLSQSLVGRSYLIPHMFVIFLRTSHPSSRVASTVAAFRRHEPESLIFRNTGELRHF